MRTLITVAAAAAALLAGPALAQPTKPSDAATAPAAYQPPDKAAQRAAMDRLAPLVGAWRGTVEVKFPAPTLVHQTEEVERALDGLALIVRGTGHATPARTEEPTFQALAVITYDDRRKFYEFRTYNEGHATTATGRFLENGAFQWSMGAGPMQMRFTIAFDEETWRETGEMSRDGGASWTPTVNMTLAKVS